MPFSAKQSILKSAIALALLLLLSYGQFAQALNVIVIGDSITRAIDRNSCYRRLLWQMLQQDQIKDVNFIGKFNGTFKDGENNTDWDADHMAIWGGSAELMAPELDQWLTADRIKNRPDVALINMGTNDLRGGKSSRQAVDNVFRLITLLRQSNPKLQVIATQITPWTADKGGANTWVGFNQEILRFSKDSTAQSPIVVVDQFTGYTLADHADGIHPNPTGAKKFADKYYVPLKKMVTGTLNPTPLFQAPSRFQARSYLNITTRNQMAFRHPPNGTQLFSIQGELIQSLK